MLSRRVTPDGHESTDSPAPAIVAMAVIVVLAATEVAAYVILTFRIPV